MRISDWSSDGCSSDLQRDGGQAVGHGFARVRAGLHRHHRRITAALVLLIGTDAAQRLGNLGDHQALAITRLEAFGFTKARVRALRSEERRVGKEGVSKLRFRRSPSK